MRHAFQANTVSDRPMLDYKVGRPIYMPGVRLQVLLFKSIFSRKNLRRQSRDNHTKRVRDCCSLGSFSHDLGGTNMRKFNILQEKEVE